MAAGTWNLKCTEPADTGTTGFMGDCVFKAALGTRCGLAFRSGRAKSKWTTDQKSTEVKAKQWRLKMESSYTIAKLPTLREGGGHSQSQGG